jgi:hypothetical protein
VEKWRLSNTPTIRRLTPSSRHQLSRIAPSFVVAVVVAIVVAVGFALVLNIFQEPAASAFSTEAVRSRPFLRQAGVAMRKTPLALNTSDLWKLNDLTDALYVIVDCHLRAKIKPSG